MADWRRLSVWLWSIVSFAKRFNKFEFGFELEQLELVSCTTTAYTTWSCQFSSVVANRLSTEYRESSPWLLERQVWTMLPKSRAVSVDHSRQWCSSSRSAWIVESDTSPLLLFRNKFRTAASGCTPDEDRRYGLRIDAMELSLRGCEEGQWVKPNLHSGFIVLQIRLIGSSYI